MDGAGMFGASHNHVPNTMITNGCERVSLEVDMVILIYSTVLPENAVHRSYNLETLETLETSTLD